jgi:hypothetical protein
MSSSSSSSAAVSSSAKPQLDFAIFYSPLVVVDDAAGPGKTRLSWDTTTVISQLGEAADHERRQEQLTSVESTMEGLLTEFMQTFLNTAGPKWTEEMYLDAVVDEWLTIVTTAKSIHEGLEFEINLVGDGPSELGDIPEEDEESSGEKASGSGGDPDSEEEPPTYKGKGKKRADPISEGDDESSGEEGSVAGSNVGSEGGPLAYKGK